MVTKTWNSVTLVSTNTGTSPRTCEFDVGFEIKVDNIGAEDLEIAEVIDLLPPGFRLDEMDLSGDITDSPSEKWENSVDRYEYKWRFNPDIELESGTSQTLKFSATANITKGDYRSDVLADFSGGSFPRDKHTWPTALIEVRDVFNVSASDSRGDSVSGLNVIRSDAAGEVNTLTLE